MSKHQKSNRESKKQSLLTPKEKKAAKLGKKHAGDHVPLIVRTPRPLRIAGPTDMASTCGIRHFS